ncbi:aldo/keto reductase [Humibacter ginsenosidimutans]|uniref:Aldo/keto reductase n=1 Tax=Humibacter ginsenosidimutans TaxID=2599293 RepID=A0A5B8M4Y7_9MICO|nr:aldo/keto reductase [Humibacter ginsenosidimutans]QDZ14630.1 aldo/keto reductase [Humibacter ginsenosidimutans]
MAQITVPTRSLDPAGAVAPGSAEAPVFALGSWNTWDRMSRDEAIALVHRAAETGSAFFDVGNYNMGPHAEGARTDILFGETVREAGLAREDYLVCGKLWLWDYPNTSFADWMRQSLDRIGIEAADCIVVGDHMAPVDIRQVVTDVHAEIEAGRFRYWGINNWPYDEALLALDVATEEGLTPPSFAQLKYGLARRSMAEGPFYGGLFTEGRLALQASDIFEGGILVGKTDPQRKIGADVGGIREQIVATWPAVRDLAQSLDATPAQLGIAFCLANPATANVLFGVSRVAQFDDALGALDLLARVGAPRLRALTADLWIDRKVNPDGTWFPPGFPPPAAATA